MSTERKILICWGDNTLQGKLNTSLTAEKLWEILPIQSIAHRWGDEVYFEVPMSSKLEEDATDVVPPGTICFWVQGNSVAIPFGKTPVSIGNECRLITRINIIGNITDSFEPLFSVNENTPIEIRKA